jgi:hypothetical protein
MPPQYNPQPLHAKEKYIHLCVVGGNRYAADVLKGVLNHLACNIVKDNASFIVANSFGQAIMFLHAKVN